MLGNDLLYEISKYITHTTDQRLLAALSSPAAQWRDRCNITHLLEHRLGIRPSQRHLLERNILREEPFSFESIHDTLLAIRFDVERPRMIAPSIAGKAQQLDFHFKKQLMIRRLGLEEYERIFKRNNP